MIWSRASACAAKIIQSTEVLFVDKVTTRKIIINKKKYIKGRELFGHDTQVRPVVEGPGRTSDWVRD